MTKLVARAAVVLAVVAAASAAAFDLPKNVNLTGLLPPPEETYMRKGDVLDVAAAVTMAHTFAVYRRELSSTRVDIGTNGSSAGDETFLYGQMFNGPPDAPGSVVVGTYDVSGITASFLPPARYRRQQIFQELTFKPGLVPTLVPALATATGNRTANYANLANSKSAELHLGGVVTYPPNGKKTDPYILTVFGGSGAFFGASGQATIDFVEELGLYRQTVTLTFPK